jgi:hypothetical protein
MARSNFRHYRIVQRIAQALRKLKTRAIARRMAFLKRTKPKRDEKP